MTKRVESLRCAVAARLRVEEATISDDITLSTSCKTRSDWVMILSNHTVAPRVCIAALDDMISDGLTAEQILNYDESCSK